MSDSEDPVDIAGDEVDDLFGDGGDDDELPSDNERVASDEDAASDKDTRERRYDDDMDVDEQDVVVKNRLVMNIQLYRHRAPKSKDGTLRSLRPPKFVRLAAEEYKPEAFEPTQWDQDNARSDNPKAVIRYQKDPETGKLKSNALMYKWSDGSVTVSVGGEHYEIQKKMLAPPADKPYQEVQDAHYYAAAAHISSNLLVTMGHVSEQYTVLPNRNIQDDAVAMLASRMQAVAKSKTKSADNIFTATIDPELQRKEAELAEKERMKAQRRRDNAAARLDNRASGYRSGGLSIGDLEGGRRGAGGPRKRGQPGGAARMKKRRPEYDSDDDLPAGRGRNEDYDLEDDFIAASDEEGSFAEDDDEEDILDDDDEEEEERPRKKRQKTAEAEDNDADADADLDDVDAPAAADQVRSRRRNIVDDEDSE